MTLSRRAVLISFPLLRPLCAQSAVTRLPPADESSSDREFRMFFRALQRCVRNKDAKWLMSALSPKIVNSFGGDGGIAEFRQQWSLDHDAPSSRVWQELTAVLNLGCARTEDGFVSPWYFAHLPDTDDWPTYLIAVVPNAPLLDSPQSSRVIARLNSDILDPADAADHESEFVRVRSRAGAEGFVRRRDTREPLWYRALFARMGGKWKMTHFVAGD